MKKQFATFFIGLFLANASLTALCYELNTSYDYFRGIPDGSWNGNSGAFVAGNVGMGLYDCFAAQLGGSYGLYNWDGRENQVFKNSKALEHEAFLTVGVSSSINEFNLGLVYDRCWVKHFSIYDVEASFDQLRFQGGYQFCSEEVGLWGTARLTTAHKHALGVPVSFKAINQINAFWSHYFENCAMTTIWLGAPYGNSLRHHHKPAGVFTAGFAVRAPLTECLAIDAHGAYMRARHASGSEQSRNWGANICVGITYTFGDDCSCCGCSYMPVANNSNFFIDSSFNN